MTKKITKLHKAEPLALFKLLLTVILGLIFLFGGYALMQKIVNKNMASNNIQPIIEAVQEGKNTYMNWRNSLSLSNYNNSLKKLNFGGYTPDRVILVDDGKITAGVSAITPTNVSLTGNYDPSNDKIVVALEEPTTKDAAIDAFDAPSVTATKNSTVAGFDANKLYVLVDPAAKEQVDAMNTLVNDVPSVYVAKSTIDTTAGTASPKVTVTDSTDSTKTKDFGVYEVLAF